MHSITYFGITGGLVGLAVWWLAMLILRKANWSNSTERRVALRGGSRRFDEIKYHNETIQRDFEIFIKFTLAVLGGITFLITSANVEQSKSTALVLITAYGLQLILGISYSLIIFSHQKAKIERWKDRYGWWEPFIWKECWMIFSIFAISTVLLFYAFPELILLIGHDD